MGKSKDVRAVATRRLEPVVQWMNFEIKIAKAPGGYVAHLDGLSGSPPIGDGTSREMAVAALFFRLMAEDGYRSKLVEAVKGFGCKLSINEVLYESIYTGKR